MKTATHVKTFTSSERPDFEQRLYRVDPPIRPYTFAEEPEADPTDYVIVSAANVPFSGPETYIFPADENGEVIDWVELGGSFRGALDHEQALRNAGYTVITEDDA